MVLRPLLPLVTLAATAAAAIAATAPVDAQSSASMQAGLDSLVAATLESRFDVIADHMHPAIISEMGGRDAAIGMIESSYGEMRAAGYTIESMEAAPPAEMYVTDDAHVAIVPLQLTVLSSAARIRSSGYLVASRPQAGGSWVFIDGSAILDQRALLIVFPGLPPGVPLPEKRQSVQTLNPDGTPVTPAP